MIRFSQVHFTWLGPIKAPDIDLNLITVAAEPQVGRSCGSYSRRCGLDLHGLFREDRKGVEDSTEIHAVADVDPRGPSARCQATAPHRQPPLMSSSIQATRVSLPLTNFREIVRFRAMLGVLCAMKFKQRCLLANWGG